MSTTAAPGAGTPAAPAMPPMGRLLLMAVVVGVLGAAAASILMEVIDGGQELLFNELPSAFGLAEAPWWWAVILLFVGAAGVALARRMPGATGKGPLTGFHFDDPIRIVPSVIVAAVFTLCFGFVLGPEAPLIVVGTLVGGLLTRRQGGQVQRAAMMLGGVAGIGAVLGNPFVTAFMIMEFVAIGSAPGLVIVPALLALAAGYVTQIGIFGLPGFGVHTLAVPGLPQYDSIEFGDIAVGLLVAVIAGLIAIVAREAAVKIDVRAQARPVLLLFVGAAVTSLVVIIAVVGFDVPLVGILFSGQTGMGALLAETSLTVVIVTLVGKAIAYSFALGSGFRGGPIFPATFLGVAGAVLVATLLPSISITPLAAAGIAAAAAAMLRLPATAALLGALLVAGGGAAVAPFAILGAVIGFVIRVVVDRRMGIPAPAGADA